MPQQRRAFTQAIQDCTAYPRGQLESAGLPSSRCKCIPSKLLHWPACSLLQTSSALMLGLHCTSCLLCLAVACSSWARPQGVCCNFGAATCRDVLRTTGSTTTYTPLPVHGLMQAWATCHAPVACAAFAQRWCSAAHVRSFTKALKRAQSGSSVPRTLRLHSCCCHLALCLPTAHSTALTYALWTAGRTL